MYNERVTYTLNSKEMGELVLNNDPINGLDPKRTFERSGKSLSFITKYSDNYEFTKEGAEYLRTYFRRFAPEGDITLKREINNPYTDVLELDYQVDLDITEAEISATTVKIKIKSGSLEDKIKAQMSEKFEFDRTEDVDGNRISDLTYESLYLDGRKIFNESYLENNESVRIEKSSYGFQGRRDHSLIFNVVYDSDDSIQSQLNASKNHLGFEVNDGSLYAASDQVFYVDSDSDKTLELDFNIKANGVYYGSGRVIEFFVNMTAVYDANDLTYKANRSDSISLGKSIIPDRDGLEYSIGAISSRTLEVKKGRSGIIYFTVTNSRSDNFGAFGINYSKSDLKIKIIENSVFPGTTTKVLTVNNAIERDIEIITGDSNNYRSDYFTQGEFKEATIASGKMIRQLNKVDLDGNPTDIPETLTTSLKDLLSMKGYFATGYGIEKIGGKEIFVVEDLKHFFRDKITINFGEASELTETFAHDYSWVSAEFGNDKAGEYEEQQGRFETNAKNKYGFPTTRAKEVYDGVSKIRTDLLGVEQARRKNESVAPTEDTTYDKEIFLFDSNFKSKIVYLSDGGITRLENIRGYFLYKWQDLLASAPKKVYDPDSVGNFRLTPMRSLFRHMWLFGTSLYKFPEEKIRYNNSTGYPEMITQYPNEPERAENGSYTVGDFIYPKMDSTIVKFTTVLTYEMKKEIQGSYIENNREIPNLYGLAEYEDETGKKQYGWVLKVDIEGKLAKVEMIKSRR